MVDPLPCKKIIISPFLFQKACISMQFLALTSLHSSLSIWSPRVLQLSSLLQHYSWAWHPCSFSQWSALPPEALSLSSTRSPSPLLCLSPRTLSLPVLCVMLSPSAVFFSACLAVTSMPFWGTDKDMGCRKARMQGNERVNCVNKPFWFPANHKA